MLRRIEVPLNEFVLECQQKEKNGRLLSVEAKKRTVHYYKCQKKEKDVTIV